MDIVNRSPIMQSSQRQKLKVHFNAQGVLSSTAAFVGLYLLLRYYKLISHQRCFVGTFYAWWTSNKFNDIFFFSFFTNSLFLILIINLFSQKYFRTLANTSGTLRGESIGVNFEGVKFQRRRNNLNSYAFILNQWRLCNYYLLRWLVNQPLLLPRTYHKTSHQGTWCRNAPLTYTDWFMPTK